MTASGSGSGESPAFHPTPSYNVAYAFDCTAVGQSGNSMLEVDNDNGEPTTGGATVNRLVVSGNGTASGINFGDYTVHVQAITECDWSIKVTSV